MEFGKVSAGELIKEKISSFKQEKRFFCLTGCRIFSNQPADSQTTDASRGWPSNVMSVFTVSERFWLAGCQK